jgi:hypothetical protein
MASPFHRLLRVETGAGVQQRGALAQMVCQDHHSARPWKNPLKTAGSVWNLDERPSATV